VHFEIAADDPERASAFYRDVFGWDIKKWEGGAVEYWLVMTGEEGPGINGGIMKRMDPELTTINFVAVESYDQYRDKVLASGGTEMKPKMNVPGVGDIGYYRDTEGNIFGIIQPEPM